MAHIDDWWYRHCYLLLTDFPSAVSISFVWIGNIEIVSSWTDFIPAFILRGDMQSFAGNLVIPTMSLLILHLLLLLSVVILILGVNLLHGLNCVW